MTCPTCGGTGTVRTVVAAWFDDVHGFDCEDEERECEDCDGSGGRPIFGLADERPSCTVPPREAARHGRQP